MRFTSIFATALSAAATVLAQTPLATDPAVANPLVARQTVGPGNLIFNAICGTSGFVRCEQALDEAGAGFCCRNSQQCVQNSNSTILSCADGTPARPFETCRWPSFASAIATASPSLYTSFLSQITGNPLLPSQILNAVTGSGTLAGCDATGGAVATGGDGGSAASSNLIPTFAIIGVWTMAAVGGAALILVR